VQLRPAYPVRTERLDLRPFAAGDFDAVLDLRSRPDVARYQLTEPRGPDQVRTFLRKATADTVLEEAGQQINLAVVLRETGELVGDVVLIWRSAENAMAELGFIFHPDHHGKGYAREASEAMLSLAFDGLGLHRVIGRCDVRNAASYGLMERLGMRREAHFRRNELLKGEWTDELVYAMLAEEWADRTHPDHPERTPTR
jgi:RimJ/RimL family protein N-acetyltransferase